MLALEDKLAERIIGQDQRSTRWPQAHPHVARQLNDPRKPIGVFLFVGPAASARPRPRSRVADLLYGGERIMTTINMSEFQEKHTVSRSSARLPATSATARAACSPRRCASALLGGAARRVREGRPRRSDLFYQVFDKGMLSDGEGRDIDFKNTVIIMTSNAGTDLIHRLCADPNTRPDSEELGEALRPELLKTFKPAFLGRCSVIPYFPLADDIIRKIVALQAQSHSQALP